MRLTLRTLLAYMDDMLDPTDQEELGRKIEASPFATELIHRSRDAVRRLRLSAPDPLAGDSGDVHGGDHNLDANTAAEYLDSILSPDDVAEFERSCLEAGPNADMLLAEAASCHHILTLVLGEPAEVDADLRQRMYALLAHSDAQPQPAQQVRIEPAHASPSNASPSNTSPSNTSPTTPAVPAAVAPVASAAPARPRRTDAELDESGVPDYILEAARARRTQRRALIAVTLAAIAGGVGTWLVMTSGESTVPESASRTVGDIDPNTVELEVGGDEPAAGAAETDPDEAAADGGEAPAFVPQPADAPTGDAPSPDASLDEAPPFDAAPTEDAADEEPATPEGAADAAAADETRLPDADETTPVEPAPDAAALADAAAPPVDPAPEDPAATVDAGAPPAIPSPTEIPAVDPAAPVVEPPADPVALPDDPADLAIPPGDVAATEAAPGADEATAEPAGPRSLATYFGNNDLLLRFDAGTKTWLRLSPRSTLSSGARLLVLPTFRTHVALENGVNAFLCGGTEVVLLNADEAGADAAADFALAVPYGRVILNSGAAGNRVALVIGDDVRVIALGPSSSLGLEVQRLFVPGIDPAREAYPVQVTWYLTTGNVEWGDESAGPSAEGQSAEGQATWTTLDGVDESPQDIDELPEWLSVEPTTSLEESAREVVEKELQHGQAVGIPLLELTDASRLGRRAEVRTLAAESSAYIGQFEALVNALSDMNERPRWKARVESLRQAVARDPAALELIGRAFAVRGEEAADHLIEMLLGYNSDDVGTTKTEVEDGALVQLISWLNNEDLSYRVLASYNINEITGTVSLGGYRPEHVASKRKGEIQFYWKRLEDGELMPRAWLATGWAPR